MATSAKGDNRESKKKIDGNKDVDPQLWHAVAGRMVRIPELNSNIFYFPQGHAEHAYEPVHFPADFNIPSEIPCRVEAIHYRADPHTDEVYAKLRLVPLHPSDVSSDDDDDAVGGIDDMSETKNKYQSCIKTLSQFDANKGGFYCPKNCAETLFPPLDYSGGKPSFQDIFLMDAHGEKWRFRHVYKCQHMLTAGWKDFVTKKRLVSGDSLVFLRAESSDLHIGIRRCKRQNDFELKSSSGEKDDKSQNNELRISDKVTGIGKVKAEDVIEAVKLGANMQPFDVVYYPSVGTPEFFVKASSIRTAVQIRWCCGMRFSMTFETEDSSRINWFMGTITSVQAADPAWPDSLWRLLQVTWDESDLLKNTKRVNPWQVEIVSNMPSIPFSSILPPSRKKLRLSQYPDFPIDGQFSVSTFPNYIQTPNVPIFHLPETSPAGMQGAKHDPLSLSLSDFHINKSPSNAVLQKANDSENVPCSPSEKQDHTKSAQIVLFGKTIRVETPNVPVSHLPETSPAGMQGAKHDPLSLSLSDFHTNKSPSKAVLQKVNESENVPCSPSEKQDHAKSVQIVLFGKTIRVDVGNENAVNKITSNSSNLLQHPPKPSSGERLECDPENQCIKETLAGETSEIEHSATSSKEVGASKF